MSKFYLVTGTDLQVEECEDAQELVEKVARKIDEGESQPAQKSKLNKLYT